MEGMQTHDTECSASVHLHMGHFDIRDGWGSDQRELAGPDHVLWIVLGIEGGGCVCPLEVSYRLGAATSRYMLLTMRRESTTQIPPYKTLMARWAF
jgi:hypothetical protein